jgi:hypothetical protein
MYCPQCGQQQVADVTRFCPRCGLALTGLAEWVAAGGGLPAVREEPTTPAPPSPRRKWMRRGAKLLFWSLVLLPVFLLISLAADEPAPLIFPFTLFFVSVVWMLYSRIFLEDAPRADASPARTPSLGTNVGGAALPPATNIYVPPAQPARTAELAQPPSVTESTTRLLDRE